MSLFRWLPWKFVIRRMARAQGFLDPVALMARLQRFIQPSEVAEPIELLRAGALFHARGLVNSRVIQHNLDWVWPFWVERQFDPRDKAFVPRAFSITHINLTHRNWTAVGVPDWPELPIVDPRGLLTPKFDGWSIDAWVIADDGKWLLPSRARSALQELVLTDAGPVVATRTATEGLELSCRVDVNDAATPVCRMRAAARAERPAWLVFSLRPCNPEGVSFIREIALSAERDRWTVDSRQAITFDAPADRHHVSDYRSGDVFIHLFDRDDSRQGQCDVEMATAAAMFRLEAGVEREITASIALPCEENAPHGARPNWSASLAGVCRLKVPDARWQRLYDAALVTLVLHSPGEVFAGPFTYKRFWFRDAAFIVHALLCAGLTERAARAIRRFPSRQTTLGYFHSQEGEWDSNGEALWIIERYLRFSGRSLDDDLTDSVRRAARWIVRKRMSGDDASPHAGLLPAGFSAEHLGPSDYYYWDDFWGVAGLRSASRLLREVDGAESHRLHKDAFRFMEAVDRSIARTEQRLGRRAIPASPYRRMDAGAIGSLAAGYPLGLYEPRDERLLDTVEYLLENCFVNGGFFQDMIHSGINCYLSLHVAQVLLRAGDGRHVDIMNAVAELASPTGQWPEAVHPHTGGGCMGDGQHVWAASEWLVMVRNCFVREEGDRLILAAGVPRDWIAGLETMSLGPAPTEFGDIEVSIEPRNDAVSVSWRARWRTPPAAIEVRLPGFEAAIAGAGENRVTLPR